MNNAPRDKDGQKYATKEAIERYGLEIAEFAFEFMENVNDNKIGLPYTPKTDGDSLAYNIDKIFKRLKRENFVKQNETHNFDQFQSK